MIFRKKRFVMLRLAVVFVTALLMVSDAVASSVGAGEDVEKRLFLDCELVCDGEVVKIDLKKSGDWEISGLLLTLGYDGEAFDLSQCCIDESLGLKLTWQALSGEVTVLLDGAQNSSAKNLVSFYFQRKDGADGAFLFTVLQSVEGYAWADDGALLPLDIDVTGTQCEVSVGGKEKTEFFNGNCELSWAEDTDGTGEFIISSEVRGFEGIALGFKLFIVDLLSKTTQSYTITSQVCIEKSAETFFFEKQAPLTPQGRFCLIVTTISYTARGYELGEKLVFYVSDGEIYK